MNRKQQDPFHRILTDFERKADLITSGGSNHEENETLALFEDAIERFAERHIDEATIDSTEKIPESVLHAAAELGLFGISIPREYGGAGLSMKACSRILSRLVQRDCSVGTTVTLHAGMGLRGLIRFGTESQRRRFLPDLASGRSIACFSLTEANAGSDIASMSTSVSRDGNELVINGTKAFATNAGYASIATIGARTNGFGDVEHGYLMLLVPLDRPGVEIGKEEHKLGLRGASTCSLHFDNVRIPFDCVLGTASQGFDQMRHVLTCGRTLMASGAVGLASKALSLALVQITQRRQFKRMIAEFGMVREKVAAMRSLVWAAESLIRLITQLEDEKPNSIGWESSVAKVFCSESAWSSVDETVQLFGGYGLIEDSGISRILRNCRIPRIVEGPNDLLRYHMATNAFLWKEDGLLEAPWLSDRMGGFLLEECRAFDELRARLAELLRNEKERHGLKLLKRQMVQHRVADICADLYALLALLVRAAGEHRISALTDERMLWTRYAAWILRKRIESTLEHHRDNSDEWASQIAADECARIGFPLREAVA